MKPLRRTGKGDLMTTRAQLHSSKRYQVPYNPDEKLGTLMYPITGRPIKRLDLTNHRDMLQPPDDLPVTLEHLDLPDSIDFIPPSIGRLKNLKTLNINSHRLKTLPPELGLCPITALHMEFCPRMDKGLWRIFTEECEALPLSAARRPGPLLEHLRRLIGFVMSYPPKRAVKVKKKGPRSTVRRRSSIMKSLGLAGGAPLTPKPKTADSKGSLDSRGKPKLKKQKGKGKGFKMSELLASTRGDDDDLTVEQLSYERDLRIWGNVNPRPQPPAPKWNGFSIEDYHHKVDTSNWAIRHTLRKPNQRFVSPYDFLGFTQAKPNKLSIFKKDEDTGKFECSDPIMYW